MTAKITRKRALELAQKAISYWMRDIYSSANQQTTTDGLYAELAAALAWLEAASRQKEMHL